MGQKGMIESRAFAGAWAQAKRGPETKPTKKTLQVDVVKFDTTADIIKVNSEQRIAYGFASVFTVDGKTLVDLQGDIILPETMEKAATSFMMKSRKGLSMHSGGQTNTIVHSLPLTREIAKAFGIDISKEGWLIGVHVTDDASWDLIKSGKFTGFSIGGKARKTKV